LIGRVAVLAVLITAGCSAPAGNAGGANGQITLSIMATCVMPDSLFIGYPADACFAPTGDILVLDQAAVELHVFTPDGTYRASFGGPGDGPGEMGNPMSVETVGGLILVRDQVKLGYIVFDEDYRFMHEVNGWPRSSPSRFRFAGGDSFTAVRTGIVSLIDGYAVFREAGLYRLDETGPCIVLYADTVPVDPGNTSQLTSAIEGLFAAADTSGRMFTAVSSADSYEVITHGNVDYSISRDVEPVRKTPEEITREEQLMNARLEAMGAEGLAGYRADPFRAVITGLGVSGDTLWVQTGLHDEAVFHLYSTFDGGFIGEAVFHCQGDWNFRISEEGILAWEDDPIDGIFRIHLLATDQSLE